VLFSKRGCGKAQPQQQNSEKALSIKANNPIRPAAAGLCHSRATNGLAIILLQSPDSLGRASVQLVKYQKANLSALLLLCLVVTPALEAQITKAPSATKHSLWKVQGNQSTVYLLGSMHVLKKENYPLPQVIESAYTNSKIAVFETDVEALEKPDLALELLAKGQLPEGETLAKQLSPAVYSAFKSYMQKTGMPAELFDTMTPSMAAISLVTLEFKKLGLDPEFGVDKYFFERAGKDGKTIIPLETVDFQIGLLTGFSKEEGEFLMKATIKDIETMEKDLSEMLKAWQTGDVAKLNKFLNEAMQESPVIYKRLVTDRTRRWVPKVEELARGKQNAIVIVGAGHLVGADGLVELLRKKGFKITQE
jgi:uncharacterized protein YbaP (TraB family)